MTKLGIIGGLGPMATAYFMQLLVQMSDAKTDQEHMDTLVYSMPSIPDRTGYIIGESKENPVTQMVYCGKKLKEIGADIIAIPCITAHYFHEELEEKIGLPIINAIEETALCLEEEKVSKVGIMATDGTIKSGLFQKTLEKRGIEVVLPDIDNQKKVMSIIYDEVKAGKSVDMARFYQISAALNKQGAEAVLLACTELSLIKRDNILNGAYLDVMEVLARKAVQCCNRVRGEYDNLITQKCR
ncbi:MAG: amino acid racemase [Clostridiales bacterium]|nr:amino acid racemase [Clostridiales bacterium]